LVSSILPKDELEKIDFALAYWGRNFSSFFGRIENTKKTFRN
jgi:hypothetical protein